MRQTLLLSITVLLLVSGCAWVNEQLGYYKVNRSTPLAEGELSPSERARQESSPLAAIPVWGGALAVGAAFVLGKFYEVQRGKAIATGEPVKKKASPVVKGLATAVEQVFDIGKKDSAGKRSWKTIVAGVLAYLLTLIPALNAWATTSDTKFGAVLLSITAAIMGLEKLLTNTATPPTS